MTDKTEPYYMNRAAWLVDSLVELGLFHESIKDTEVREAVLEFVGDALQRESKSAASARELLIKGREILAKRAVSVPFVQTGISRAAGITTTTPFPEGGQRAWTGCIACAWDGRQSCALHHEVE